MTAFSDDDRAAVVALSGLPGMGPARLRAVVADRAPAAVWAAIANGRCRVTPALAATSTATQPVDLLLGAWRESAAGVDPVAELSRHVESGIAVVCPGDECWPVALTDDPDPPAVLFVRGEARLLTTSPSAVAIVGTRRCSRYGWDVAHRLGVELAAAGVSVVSGLASGIDGAAHRGAIEQGGAPPIGVVASGLDIVYPRAHQRLWHEVATAGVLVSEGPLGTPPTRWRFPARNRIIAALADAVVVVESGATGGALHTVDEAQRRDRPVLAVPGPITSSASIGTNRLLADGAAPVCDVDDVLLAVGLDGRGASQARGAVEERDGAGARVLDALGWTPATLDQLVLRTGLGLGELARVLARLEAHGSVAVDGGWYERRS